MAVFFVHRCATCKKPACSAAKRSASGTWWDHVAGRYRGESFDHEVTAVLTERVEETVSA